MRVTARITLITGNDNKGLQKGIDEKIDLVIPVDKPSVQWVLATRDDVSAPSVVAEHLC
jgi:hypothetical protein